LRTGETWYLRLGDKPFAALAALVLLAAWLATGRRREPTGPSHPEAP
jgi:apolipoprotein N-acyltransferase